MENNTQQKLNPKFFFISLGVLGTLITVVISFLQILFAIIEKKFPDALNAIYSYGYNAYDTESIRTSLAVLIIVFPVCILLTYFWNTMQKAVLGSIDVHIKRWMIYLILFIASIVILVDLITLVRYFVAGELTTRFIYKVLVTLISAGIVGGYYIHELRNIHTYRKLYAGGTVILVIATIICSFMVIGSPKEQRMWRMDERRVQDLQTIQWQVTGYWQQKGTLPQTLESINNPLQSVVVPIDPEFQKGMMYEYTSTGPLSFELCATFYLPRKQGFVENGYAYGGMREASVSKPSMSGNDSWMHDAGRTCFARTIDTDMFPRIPQDAE